LPDVDVIDSRLTCNMGFVGPSRDTIRFSFAALVGVAARCFSSKRAQLLWNASLLFLDDCVSWFSDAMTNGGLGIAFLLAVRSDAILFSVKPILVSRLDSAILRNERRCACSEIIYVWLPALAIGLALYGLRNDKGRTGKEGAIKNN